MSDLRGRVFSEVIKPEVLLALHVGSPSRVGPLTLFPVWTDAPLHARRRYVTTGAVVEELPEPHVGMLQVSNPRHRPLLLCEGSILEGGLGNVVAGCTPARPAATGPYARTGRDHS